MATTVHEPPKIELDRLPSQGSGNGDWRNLVPAGGGLRGVKEYAPPPASTGVWVGLAAITMFFAAFTSALIVRQGAAPDWQHITLPPILYLDTLIIIASSVTLELARRRIAAFMGGVREREVRKRKTRRQVPRSGCTSRWVWACFSSPDRSMPGCNCNRRDSECPPT